MADQGGNAGGGGAAAPSSGGGAPAQGGTGGVKVGGQGGLTIGNAGGAAQANPLSRDGRASIGDFGRFIGNGRGFEGEAAQDFSTTMDVAEDPNDQYSPLKTGDDQLAQRGIQELADSADEDEAEVVEASLLEESDEYQAWKASHEKLQAIENSDDLPEDLLKKFVQKTVDGQRWRTTVAEAIRGAQRQDDYTAKLEELYRFRDQLLGEQAGLQRIVAALRGNADEFEDAITYIGGLKSAQMWALRLGLQLDNERKMDPRQRALVQRDREHQLELRRLAARNAALEAQMQQQQVVQPSQSEQYTLNQLQQMWPRAEERLVKTDTPWVESELSRFTFAKHWATRIQDFRGELTTEFVADVMASAMGEVQRLVAAGQVAAPQPAAAQTVPPVSKLTGPVRPGLPPGQGAQQPQQRNGRAKSARIGDFGRMVTR